MKAFCTLIFAFYKKKCYICNIMIERLHAIVLRVVKYNDRMQIADVLTREHGRLSFTIPEGSAASHRKSARTMWRPLALLEFDADLKPKASLPRGKDVRVYATYEDLPYNPMKAMVALFLDELLNGAIWGEQPDFPLYDFIEQSLILLDKIDKGMPNFHVAFAVQLLKFLGIVPAADRYPWQRYYDLRAAEYTDSLPPHENRLADEEALAFEQVMRMNYRNMSRFRFTRKQRQRILEVINDYYMLHVPDFRRMKSLAVFAEALDE